MRWPNNDFCYILADSITIAQKVSQYVFTARCYASAVLAMGLCPSVTGRCSIETGKRIELVFVMRAFFHPSYTVLTGNSAHFKNKGTSLWNSVPNSRQKNLLWYIDRRNVLSTQHEKGGRSERDKLDRRRSTKLTIPPSSDARPL